MFSLRIPPDQRSAVRELAGLTPEKRNELLESFRKAAPSLDLLSLVPPIAASSGGDEAKIRSYLLVLANIRLTADRNKVPLDQLLQDLRSTLSVVTPSERAAGLSPLTQEQFDQFQEFVNQALSTNSSVGVSVKAWDLLVDAERCFIEARVLTDLRSIFPSGVPDQPVAALVQHILRITFTRRDSPRDEDRDSIYFQMDRKDLEALRAVIERAIQKETALQAEFKDKLPILVR